MPEWKTDEYRWFDGCESECTSDFLKNVWTVGPDGWSEKVPDHFNRQSGTWSELWFNKKMDNDALMKCWKEWFETFYSLIRVTRDPSGFSLYFQLFSSKNPILKPVIELKTLPSEYFDVAKIITGRR